MRLTPFLEMLFLVAAGRDSPWWVEAISTRMVQAEAVAIGIPQTRFTPEPRLIRRLRLELDPRFPQLCYLPVEILAFEVNDDLIVLRDGLDQIE